MFELVIFGLIFVIFVPGEMDRYWVVNARDGVHANILSQSIDKNTIAMKMKISYFPIVP
jgi:hypothetical protein